MPPKWSLGYHQCRWSYMSDQKVLKVLGATLTLSLSVIMTLWLIKFFYVENLSWRCWVWHIFFWLLLLLSFFFTLLLFGWLRIKGNPFKFCLVCLYYNMQDITIQIYIILNLNFQFSYQTRVSESLMHLIPDLLYAMYTRSEYIFRSSVLLSDFSLIYFNYLLASSFFLVSFIFSWLINN